MADWAHCFQPTTDDIELARRSLIDTLAVALAGRGHPLIAKCATLGDAGRWAVAAHVLDFDDLHMESTSHVSAVIVPTVLACGGDARTYLAGAGVMARLGTALGWSHYTAGWHATCTAGAPAAAVTASLAMGLDTQATAHAIALSIPAAGAVQRAFGTEGKSLQVGMAADAGVRAATLAAAGARSDLAVVEQWLELVGASWRTVDLTGPTVPGGLAIKLYPCCYAMQRPISAVRAAWNPSNSESVTRIRVTTPVATVQPLIHHRPVTGLQAKFSLEYAVATALVDGFPDLGSFTDRASMRPAVQDLLPRVDIRLVSGADGLLAGEVVVDIDLRDGSTLSASMGMPPGSPDRPPTDEELAAKVAGCGAGIAEALVGVDWATAAAILRAIS